MISVLKISLTTFVMKRLEVEAGKPVKRLLVVQTRADDGGRRK